MAATTASSMLIATVKQRAFASQKGSKTSIANFGTDIKGASWTSLKSSFHISSTRPFSHGLTSTAVKVQRVITKAMSENSEMKPLSGLPIDLRVNGRKISNAGKIGRKTRNSRVIKVMVQQVVQGASATYAKEMERLSAKESLLLAFKDAGGFEALVTGKTTDMQRIDVNERITGLERLNPTPRPTTSPFMEGRWNFDWIGSGSPGLSAARFLFERFPPTLANLSKMDVVIKDGSAKITAILKLLNSIESKFILSTKLTVEGPLRMKEEYIEGILESPMVDEANIPEQLKGAFGQAVSTVQQLPALMKDTVARGLKVPLNGTYQRLFMISYLDEEILIIRDVAGIPEVLTRLEAPPSPMESIPEYDS